MAGIYIHIPFCRQACHYCDFHFSTNLKNQEQLVSAMNEEIAQRRNYLLSEPIQTIYFGGGTPSLLTREQIASILKTIANNFSIHSEPEITFEANPEDLDLDKAKQLKDLGITRLSLGVQTFENRQLEWMNRIHNEGQVYEAYQNSRIAGFKNISIDLIYALPHSVISSWKSDLKNALELQPEHISLYGLTIERRTVFGKWEEDGKLIQVPEDTAANEYLYAVETMNDHGYDHYEVSNFCKPGFGSRHNAAYWKGIPYLGIGPGAHSFNTKSRQINIRNNARYLKGIKENKDYYETESLSKTQLLNEQILTSLRTSKGLDLVELTKKSSIDVTALHRPLLDKLSDQGLIKVNDATICLTPNGFLVADEVALRMFFPE